MSSPMSRNDESRSNPIYRPTPNWLCKVIEDTVSMSLARLKHISISAKALGKGRNPKADIEICSSSLAHGIDIIIRVLNAAEQQGIIVVSDIARC